MVLQQFSLSSNETVPDVLDHTLFENYPEGLLEFAAAACIIFVLVGVPGNLLTAVALLRCPRLRANATTTFIVHLCLADGFFCLSSLPFAASTFIRRRWIHGHTLCVLYPMIKYTNVAVSLLTVAAITINRYILICHPEKYRIIYKKWTVGLMILSLWLVSMILMLPPLFEVWGKFGFDHAVGTCTILRHNGSPKTTILVLGIVFPGVVFLVCYTRIFLVVRRAKKAVTGHQGREGANADNQDSKHNSRANDLRLLKIILVIFCSFVLCFLPNSIVKVFKKENDLPTLNVIGYLGVFVTACTNPIVYVVMSAEYRQAYKNLFTCRSNK